MPTVRLSRAYRALRQFDARMDMKYDRDPSCNRRQGLATHEIDELNGLERQRNEAALLCTDEQYASVVAAYENTLSEAIDEFSLNY